MQQPQITKAQIEKKQKDLDEATMKPKAAEEVAADFADRRPYITDVIVELTEKLSPTALNVSLSEALVICRCFEDAFQQITKIWN